MQSCNHRLFVSTSIALIMDQIRFDQYMISRHLCLSFTSLIQGVRILFDFVSIKISRNLNVPCFSFTQVAKHQNNAVQVITQTRPGTIFVHRV